MIYLYYGSLVPLNPQEYFHPYCPIKYSNRTSALFATSLRSISHGVGCEMKLSHSQISTPKTRKPQELIRLAQNNSPSYDKTNDRSLPTPQMECPSMQQNLYTNSSLKWSIISLILMLSKKFSKGTRCMHVRLFLSTNRVGHISQFSNILRCTFSPLSDLNTWLEPFILGEQHKCRLLLRFYLQFNKLVQVTLSLALSRNATTFLEWHIIHQICIV